MICVWLRNVDFQIAPEKTEAVLLSGRKTSGDIRFRVEVTEVVLRNQVRYVVFDRKE